LFANCHYADCRYAEYYYAVCHYAKGCYEECFYTECHYAECHGARGSALMSCYSLNRPKRDKPSSLLSWNAVDEKEKVL
jgi:hypothetical protein